MIVILSDISVLKLRGMANGICVRVPKNSTQNTVLLHRIILVGDFSQKKIFFSVKLCAFGSPGRQLFQKKFFFSTKNVEINGAELLNWRNYLIGLNNSDKLVYSWFLNFDRRVRNFSRKKKSKNFSQNCHIQGYKFV